MKLVTFRESPGAADKVGALIEQRIFELSDPRTGTSWPSMLALIEAGSEMWEAVRASVANAAGDMFKLKEVELRAPIPLPPQYRDAMCFHKHIRQSFPAGAIVKARMSGDPEALAEAERAAAAFEIPDIHFLQPVYYKGNRFAVGHPDQTVKWPEYSRLMDFELELACIIGRGGKNIKKSEARNHIFGFTILNDLSARDAQGLEMQGLLGPAKGKDFDNANVFGPCIVTAHEIGDPYQLKMTASVNGEVWGTGNSSDMHWKFEDLIEHISRDETLYAGEIIGSGTVGDGCGIEHQRFLKDGDTVELQIDKIGTLRTKIVR